MNEVSGVIRKRKHRQILAPEEAQIVRRLAANRSPKASLRTSRPATARLTRHFHPVVVVLRSAVSQVMPKGTRCRRHHSAARYMVGW